MTKRFINKLRLEQVLIDFMLIVCSLYLAYCLTEQTTIVKQKYYFWFFKAVFFMAAIRFVVNYFFGLYRQIWRFISLDDVINIFKAATIGSLIGVFVIFVAEREVINHTMFLADWFLCFGLFSGVRVFRRYITARKVAGRLERAIKKERVLLYGGGSGADIFIRQVKNDPSMKMDIIGILDDDPNKEDAMIHNIKVLGSGKDALRIIQKQRIDQVVITIPTASRQVIDDIYRAIGQSKVKIRTMPSLYEVLNDEKMITKIRDLDISDLLGRDVVKVDFTVLKKAVKGKRVLVTGCAGSIGQELCKQIAQFEPERLVGLDSNENGIFWLDRFMKYNIDAQRYRFLLCDVRNKKRVEEIIKKENIGYIFHAAAFKHVPLSAENVSAYVLNNVFSTKNLIEIVRENKNIKRLCVISTDKAVNPANVMGATKALGEEIILKANETDPEKRFCFVRFGNVLGSEGSVIPIFKKMIADGGPVKVTHPATTRYFMDMSEAVNLVLEAVFIESSCCAYVLDMGVPVKISELAKLVIKLSGLNERVMPIEYVGLRPGEKLTEELFNSETEKLIPASHKKIFCIAGSGREQNIGDEELNSLMKSAEEYDDVAVMQMLLKMFPNIMLSCAVKDRQ